MREVDPEHARNRSVSERRDDRFRGLLLMSSIGGGGGGGVEVTTAAAVANVVDRSRGLARKGEQKQDQEYQD